MSKIIIIGTSHIAQESIKEARDVILKEKPDCVALELDSQRYYALVQGLHQRPPITKPMYFVLHKLQFYLGEKTGVLPGSEMLAAIEAAQKVKAQIVLIDMDINKIIEKLNKTSFIEKVNLMFKLLISLLPFSKQQFDLSKVPPKKLIKEALIYMRKETPSIYKILITDRNRYMAKWINRLSKRYEKIVVVIGAGHKDGLKKLLRRKICSAKRRLKS